MSAVQLNNRSLRLVERLIADREGLGVAVRTLAQGTVVVDLGIAVRGSLEAGRLMAEACMAGLGQVAFCELSEGGMSLMGVQASISRPELACMASQYAGWAVSLKGPDGKTAFFAMGSGPARALARSEALFARIDHREPAENAVLILEGRTPPTEEVALMIARACGIAPSRLYLAAAPTASLAGSVQIAARAAETGLHKLHELGFPLSAVVSAFATCPLAPLAKDDMKAIGRTNDAVLYGAKTWYTVDCEDQEVLAVLDRAPSLASPDYGTPFYELFTRCGGDFYKIDPMLFSPARFTFNNLRTGSCLSAGQTNPGLLRASFGL